MKAKWIAIVTSIVLITSLVQPATAEETGDFSKESIYDLLVDRYFNQDILNDYEADARDINSFSGGDFSGVIQEMNRIQDMGFTILSIGPVFASSTYDGKAVLDYRQFERHFGTEEEFVQLVEAAHDRDMKLMIDLPTQSLDENHVWFSENPEWFEENEDGTVALETSNPEVRDALIQEFTAFVGNFDIDALRLQDAASLDADFIREFSQEIKTVRDIYIIGDEEMEPTEGLDAVVMPGAEDILRSSYRNFDQESERLPALLEESAGQIIQVDSLKGPRFTSDVVEERGFPPTRWKLLLTQMFTMPGVPNIQYGSEIAMSGDALPEAHQILDIGVEAELNDHIESLNTLRNSSSALRSGKVEILLEEDGWLVYERSNEEETWIIVINNSSSTKNFIVSEERIGSDMQMRGLFENDMVRQADNGTYRITMNRETSETFHVTEERGFNMAYIATLAAMYLIFLAFVWLVWRKGKQRKADEASKAKLKLKNGNETV